MIPPKTGISASGPVDGIGEPHPEGSYIRISVSDRNGQRNFQISLGAAEVLAAELQGILTTAAASRMRRP